MTRRIVTTVGMVIVSFWDIPGFTNLSCSSVRGVCSDLEKPEGDNYGGFVCCAESISR